MFIYLVPKEHWLKLGAAGKEGERDFNLDKVKIENKYYSYKYVVKAENWKDSDLISAATIDVWDYEQMSVRYSRFI